VGYVTREGEGASAAEIKGRLKERIPEYMMPWVIVMMEEMPLNANGKIDRSALPPVDLARTLDEETYVAPRNPIESIIGSLWSEVLKVEQIGVSDNFFELGGHSVLAAMLISRLRQLFHLEMPLRRLFEAPTLADFSDMVIRNLLSEEDELSRERIMKEIEHMPQEEIIALLNSVAVEP
jgi:surfactin family lipopeptide synthetase A